MEGPDPVGASCRDSGSSRVSCGRLLLHSLRTRATESVDHQSGGPEVPGAVQAYLGTEYGPVSFNEGPLEGPDLIWLEYIE